MSFFEFNKFFAALLVAIILFGIIGLVGDFFVNLNEDLDQETAYKIEIPENDEGTKDVAITEGMENISPVSPLLVTASIENGEKIYKKCSTCHNYKKGSSSKVGPSLWNIINSPKGAIEGFAYSDVLLEFGGKWSYEELNQFLYKPKDYIKGTKMNFAGLKKEQDRADLILWLREQSDNPASLPQ